ncbi:hypothetical protein [Algoriella sp.]|uniref:YncE family protein n=1 Tax=Algoriella sp. TaxID=1872434 RepID=UPI001B0B0B32|nr:hypothetical protein [Algoriella sp.]MBO6212776.1 hypothetical protein [Algoriella sp.]
MKYLAIFLFFILTNHSFAQVVENIDTLSIDDYKMETLYLPPTLNEISTLEYEKEDKNMASFWGLNDNGNKPELYRFDVKTGEIINTIFITNAPNIDWEEISTDDTRIYFADFGNNMGNRKNLAIYFIDKKQVDFSKPKQELKAQKIEFYYPEQAIFQFKNLTTNWDAEAFFIYNDKIHIFTKEWSNLQTTHYVVPIDITKKHAAQKLETFKTNYAVTAAYINTDKNNATHGIYLLGYTKDALAFINWFDLPKNNEDLFFTSQVKKISLPLGFTTQLGQLEGISVLATENKICFSGEEFNFKGFYAKQVMHCINNFTN